MWRNSDCSTQTEEFTPQAFCQTHSTYYTIKLSTLAHASHFPILKLVWDNRVRKCKCHGVSGACSMRTCWQRVNEFRRVGSMLKSAYDDAIRVTYEPRGDRLKPVETYDFHNRLPSGYSARTLRHEADRLMNARPRVDWLMPVRKYTVTSGNSGGFNGGSASPFPSTITPESISRRRQRWPRSTATMVQVSKAKLVYLEESPNYCRYDPSIGESNIIKFCPNLNRPEAERWIFLFLIEPGSIA